MKEPDKINHIPRERKRKRSRGCVFSISCCFLCVRTKLIRHLVPVFLFTSTSIGDGSSGYVWGRICCIDVVDMPMTWNNTKVSQSIVIGSDVRPIQIRWLLVARFWKSTFLNLTAFWHFSDNFKFEKFPIIFIFPKLNSTKWNASNVRCVSFVFVMVLITGRRDACTYSTYFEVSRAIDHCYLKCPERYKLYNPKFSGNNSARIIR